jgi:hypothetical protein
VDHVVTNVFNPIQYARAAEPCRAQLVAEPAANRIAERPPLAEKLARA